jgi:hypothetical protein
VFYFYPPQVKRIRHNLEKLCAMYPCDIEIIGMDTVYATIDEFDMKNNTLHTGATIQVK